MGKVACLGFRGKMVFFMGHIGLLERKGLDDIFVFSLHSVIT
jgi:hypothetical protein